MQVNNFARLCWLYKRLRDNHEDGRPATIIRSTDLQNAMYITGRHARKLMLEWYEDGYFNRVFTGDETRPRYDYVMTKKAVHDITALDDKRFWYNVASVEADIKQRYQERPANDTGSSILKRFGDIPTQKRLL